MALPDRFEQVGIVVGSAVMLALPVGELSTVLTGMPATAWWLQLLWLVPGFLVGLALVAGALPVTYSQVWAFSLLSWILTFVGWGVAGVGDASTNRQLGFGIWFVAVLVGAGLAWIRPLRVARRYLGAA